VLLRAKVALDNRDNRKHHKYSEVTCLHECEVILLQQIMLLEIMKSASKQYYF